MKLKVSMFLMLAMAAASCVDIPDFDDTPKIYYNGVDQTTEVDENTGRKLRENVVITIDFEDGDGDLGILPADRGDTVKYGDWGNYELVTMRKQANGTWTESILFEDRYKWMPILKPDGKPGPIRGKLDYNTSYPYGNSTIPVTIKYKVRVRDQALRVSNQIETDTIQVPGYR